MSQKFDINNLRIAAPCPVSWDAMAGDGRKRFCGSCEHSVYNISAMTESEVRELIGISQGRLCGRIYRRADGTVMTKDCPTRLRALRRRTAAFAGAALSALTALLGMASVSYGQTVGDVPAHITDRKLQPLPQARDERAPIAPGRTIVTGRILGPEFSPMANVEIRIYPAGADRGDFKRTVIARSDKDGNYIFDGLPPGKYILYVAHPETGSPRTHEVTIADGEQLTLDVRMPSEDYVTGLIMALPPPPPKTMPGKRVITREELDRMPRRNLFNW